MVIEPKSLDFCPRTLVIPHKGWEEAGSLSPGILKPVPIDGSLVEVGNIVSVSHGSVYITKDLMGGRNVLTWEMVSQPLLVVTLTDETHFLHK